MAEIKFFLPNFYKEGRNLFLAKILEENPEIFLGDISIGAVYGSFPGAIWNGGRVSRGIATKDEMIETVETYEKLGIPIRFSFTNPLIEPIHLLDTYCNMALAIADNGLNEVLVNSPILEDFIRSKYPGYKVNSSTTKGISSMEALTNELDGDYAYVVPDTSLNHAAELFDLPLASKDRIELLVNSYCQDCCPSRKAHYDEVGRAQLEFDHGDFGYCKHINRSFYETMAGNKSFITAEDLYGKYVPAGFSKFKLDGRGFKKEKVVESYVYYMIKDDYKDLVREHLMKV